MKFREKPVEIEAIHNERGKLKEVETFLAGREMPGLYKAERNWRINWGNSHVKVRTRFNGWQTAFVGDWIIKQDEGRFSVWQHSLFEQTYEPIQ